MYDGLSKNELFTALDELIRFFGVNEDILDDDLITPLLENDTNKCVCGIAAQLGLPVRIILSFVPKGFKPGNDDGFRSSALVRTNKAGRGIGSITAQVSIPHYLPMFGSAELQNYPIRVRASKDCREHPYTFVAIMAHELSHILLGSVRYAHKDSELHTDLTPILLGFSEIVRRGRKTIKITTSGNTETTRTTSYGYLTDSQFDIASRHVRDVLRRHRRFKEDLVEITNHMRRELSPVERSLAIFCDYFKYLDVHPPKNMRAEHSQRVVELHAQDYSSEAKKRIAVLRSSLVCVETFTQNLNHYTSAAVNQLMAHTRELNAAFAEITRVTVEVNQDIKILRRYVSFSYRLRRTLRAWVKTPHLSD